jgi:DNA primase
VTVQAEGLDPCDVRIAHGDAAVRDLIARRVPLYEFAIRSLLDEYDLDTAEGRIAALDATAQFIARIKDDALRKVYAGRVDRWLGLNDPELILSRIAGHLPGRGSRGSGSRRAARASDAQENGNGHRGPFSQNTESPYDLRDPVVQLERQVLQLAVQRPGLCGPEFDALGADAFTVSAHRAVFTLIAASGGTAAGGGSGRAWAARLREQAPNERAQAFVTGLAVEPLVITGEPDAKYADVVLARIGELAVSREITSVKARLQRMNPVEEQAGYNRIFGDLVALETRRRALLDRAAGG